MGGSSTVTVQTEACSHYRSSDPFPGIRLLIVDDSAAVRTALAEVLSDEADLTVVGECGDGSEVVEAVARVRPDVVLMDLSMPGMDGLTATRKLRGAQPDARVVVLTGDGDGARPAAAAAGAQALVPKEVGVGPLLRCLRSVAAGCRCCPHCLCG